jgi:hypothetical protein
VAQYWTPLFEHLSADYQPRLFAALVFEQLSTALWPKLSWAQFFSFLNGSFEWVSIIYWSNFSGIVFFEIQCTRVGSPIDWQLLDFIFFNSIDSNSKTNLIPNIGLTATIILTLNLPTQKPNIYESKAKSRSFLWAITSCLFLHDPRYATTVEGYSNVSNTCCTQSVFTLYTIILYSFLLLFLKKKREKNLLDTQSVYIISTSTTRALLIQTVWHPIFHVLVIRTLR